MLCGTGNMAYRDNNLVSLALEELRERLPPKWRVSPAKGQGEVDGYLRLSAPDKRSARLAIEVKRGLEPRDIVSLRNQLLHRGQDERWLVVAPYLSPAVRDRLRESDFAYVDLTGNVHVELSEPGLYIETPGADVDPDPKTRPSRSLRGARAGRVVRGLIDSKKPPGVRELAERTGVDPGYVSRVLALLDREALIERRGRGQVVKVDWVRLLRRWANEAPLASRGTLATYLEPRGLTALETKLAKLETDYAITGTLAATRVAPLAPPRLATVYVEDMTRFVKNVDLRPAETGGNVLVIEPGDPQLAVAPIEERGLRYVALSQAAADLMTSPGRGPEEAEELIAWMTENEAVWRG
jgi:hypothetical protein